jgi:alpha-tubulin suppressor-like RCC1 family protein
MNQLRWLGVTALVLALAACGGGSDGEAEAPPAGLAKLSQAAVAPSLVPQGKLLQAPRAAPTQSAPVRMAAAIAAAAPTADAFFDWAERTQFDLFPGPQSSQSLPPYVYRYYPTNQLYLAVSGEQIYALGPITNNQVVTLGKLSDYACFVSLASCAPPPVPTPSATLNAPNSGKAPWKLATPITVALKDSAGNLVSGALSCASANTVALTVAADCSSVTGHRLGQQTVTVSGGGVVANTSVKVIPQAQPLGTQGATSYFNLAVTPAGRVLAWGRNYAGVLGQGKTYSQLASLSLPTLVKDQSGLGELTGIVAVSVGDGPSALALTEDGEVWSWGSHSALGRTATNHDDPLPGKVRNGADNGSLSRIVAVSIGDNNAMALADDGTVHTWGDYAGHQNANNGKRVPDQVRAVAGVGVLDNVAAISAGWNWSAALTAEGKVVTWGYNGTDALTGQGVTTSTVDVPGYVLRDSDGAAISDIVAISSGYNFGLALTSAGQIYAWGSNYSGQLGQGTDYNVHARAVLVKSVDGSGLIGNIRMVAAGGNHALALDQDGKVFSWGVAYDGSLGDGPNNPRGNRSKLPGAVVREEGTGQLTGIGAISAGHYHSLALAGDGRLLIWGDGSYGTLGQGGTSTTDLTVPTPVKDTAGTGTLSLAPVNVWPNLTRRGR